MDSEMVEIQLTGVEDLARRGRDTKGGIKFYGHRVSDAAQRLVVVEVSALDAEDLIDYMGSHQDMPSIEVPKRSWAYAGLIAAGTAKFKVTQ